MFNINDVRKSFNSLDKRLKINTTTVKIERFDSVKDVIKVNYANSQRAMSVKINQAFFDISPELFDIIVNYAYACVAHSIINKSKIKQGSAWKTICARVNSVESLKGIKEIQDVLDNLRKNNSNYFITCPHCKHTETFIKLNDSYIKYLNGKSYTCKNCGWVFNKSPKKININKNNVIDQFNNEYFFLSNFFFSDITYEGIKYSSVESAFQASKSLDFDIRREFSSYTPSEAKKKGRNVQLRPDWEDVKVDIMKELILIKFTSNTTLKNKLLSTGDAELIEGNTWNDKFWGVCNGEGENHLGLILMEVRDNLKN